ncbi:MAG: hypothetical protein QXT64_08740 [Desulfurococcaceae archaeon]
MDDPSPEPAWFRALKRLAPALDTVRVVPLCMELSKIEHEIASLARKALDTASWKDLAGYADELVELSRFKELTCKS